MFSRHWTRQLAPLKSPSLILPLPSLPADLHLVAPLVERFPNYCGLTESFRNKYRGKDKVSLDNKFMGETFDKSSGFIPKISPS